MSDFICEEIVIEILKKLSIKDAVRCIAVCKSWYTLITSPSFISLHSQHHQIASPSTNNKSLLLVRDRSGKPKNDHYSLHFDDETFQEHKSLVYPFASSCYDTFAYTVVGCVSGVVCLSKDVHGYTDLIFLWNPLIRKYVRLPMPIFSYPNHGDSVCNVGFGFDAVNNDFKVVRVAYLDKDLVASKVVLPRVEVYESRIGSWRSVDAQGFPFIIDKCSPQAFVRGNVHWVMGSKRMHKELNSQNWFMRSENQFEYLIRRSTNLIVSFDLTSEVFKVMNVPDSITETGGRNFRVSVLGESLSLIHHTWSVHDRSCCIWVMKQYGEPDSWTKLFNVDVTMRDWRVVGFRRNGEALLKAVSPYFDFQLVSFDPKSRQVNHLGAVEDWGSFYVDSFVESLALIGVKGVSYSVTN